MPAQFERWIGPFSSQVPLRDRLFESLFPDNKDCAQTGRSLIGLSPLCLLAVVSLPKSRVPVGSRGSVRSLQPGTVDSFRVLPRDRPGCNGSASSRNAHTHGDPPYTETWRIAMHTYWR